jgi:uncharacterized protein YeaO (DUF488 family)
MDTRLKHPTGRLFTTNPKGLRKLQVDAELWQITRAGIELPNTIQVPGLSPSPQLFRKFVSDWKPFPPSKWWSEYEGHFQKELESNEKLQGLRDIYKKLLLGKNVVLICFCKDHRYCHRRLVADFFKPYGVEAEELNPITKEQLSLF